MRPLVTLSVVLVVAAALAPAAWADGGPSPGVSFDPTGISDGRGFTYATTQAGNLSSLLVRDHAGRVVRKRTFDGLYGIPYVTFGGAMAGLSRDSRVLVVARVPAGGHVLSASSRLLVLDGSTFGRDRPSTYAATSPSTRFPPTPGHCS
jgi:hypothetical protein